MAIGAGRLEFGGLKRPSPVADDMAADTTTGRHLVLHLRVGKILVVVVGVIERDRLCMIVRKFGVEWRVIRGEILDRAGMAGLALRLSKRRYP